MSHEHVLACVSVCHCTCVGTCLSIWVCPWACDRLCVCSELWVSLGIYLCSAFVSMSLVCVCHCVCVYARTRVCMCVAVGMSGTVCLCLHLCVHITGHVCWCVCMCVSLCPCVAVCLCLPWRCHLQQLQGQPGTAPAPPSLLSFIIICHEREPRRMVINKGHLKYKTTTLTLGNISSLEQLVPPLSLWKGVPGAANPCPASSASLTSPISPLPPPLPYQFWSWRL